MIARTIYLTPCAPTQCEALFVEPDALDFAMCCQEALVYAQEFPLDYSIPMCARCLGLMVQTPVLLDRLVTEAPPGSS